MPPDFTYETEIGDISAGIDEAGRGPLAGPVLAAAVILPPNLVASSQLTGLDDSKKLKAEAREHFYHLLKASADCGVGMADIAEIEKHNILQATFLAMRRAVENLSQTPRHLLVDGNSDPKIGIATTCLVKGDSLSLSIAAASVIAKHRRDERMLELAVEYPHYGWLENKGYGTASHRKAIAQYGLTCHHRPSFCRNIKPLS